MSLEFTADDIFARVKRLFGDESGVQIEENDIILWVNDAIREASIQNSDLRQGVAFYDSVVDQKEYALTLGGLDTSIQDILSVHYLDGQAYFQLRWLPLTEMHKYLDGWEGDLYGSGLPQVYTREKTPNATNDPLIVIFPAPDEAITNAIKVNYSRYPVAIDSLEDSIDLSAHYSQYVLEYCLMKAYEMDENWEAADRKAQYVQSTLNLLGSRERANTESYPSLTVMPGDLD